MSRGQQGCRRKRRLGLSSVSYSCEHPQSVSPPWGQFLLEVAVESSWHFSPVLEEPVLSNPTPAWDSSSSQATALPRALLWAPRHRNLLSSGPSSGVWVWVLQGGPSQTLDFSNPSLGPLCPPPELLPAMATSMTLQNSLVDQGQRWGWGGETRLFPPLPLHLRQCLRGSSPSWTGFQLLLGNSSPWALLRASLPLDEGRWYLPAKTSPCVISPSPTESLNPFRTWVTKLKVLC